MKDIKFRAFHKPSKKIFGICCLDFKNKMISSRQKVIGQGKRVYFDTVDYDLKDCELMQFTGLKDVDGKDIFEGDIIQGAFVSLYPYDGEGFKFKVVGNIHQNSELLEKK